MSSNIRTILFSLIITAFFGLTAAAQLPPGTAQMNPFESGLGTRIEHWVSKVGDIPGAEETNFDDSGWSPIGIGDTIPGNVFWLRTKLSLPPELNGKPVFLTMAVNNSATVYVDGKQLFAFHSQGSALMTRSADASHTYVIAMRGLKDTGNGNFTYASYRTVGSTQIVTIGDAINTLGPFTSINSQPVSGWLYKTNIGSKASKPGTSTSSWDKVFLPYSMGNSALQAWFRTEYSRSEKINGLDTAGDTFTLDFSLRTTADIYINGKKVQSIQGSGSLDITRKLPPGKTVTLAVKVMDMGGYGKLSGVREHAHALDTIQSSAAELIAKLKRAKLFFEQHPAPPADTIAAIRAMESEIRDIEKLTSAEALQNKLNTLSRALDPVDKRLAEFPAFHQGPYLQNVTQNSITVMWETLVPATSELHYGRNFLNRVVRDDTPKTIHELTITGLEPETEYMYAAVSGSLAAPTSKFRTAINRDTPFKFAVWGDNRTDPVSHESVVDAMIKCEPDIAVNVGDVVSAGNVYEQWSSEYFVPMRRLAIDTPTYIAIGNHEYGGYGYGSRVPWFEKFVSHPGDIDYYYSFVYGNSFFLVLDPTREIGIEQVRPGSEQYNWMLGQFESEAYKNATFRFVFFHEPPYSECWGRNYYDGEPKLRRDLVPLLEKYDVDMVFSGHTHDYERGQWPKPDGPYYIISGGGGSSLDDTRHKDWEQIDTYSFIYHHIMLSINGGHLKFEAIDRLGNVFDSFEINK